MSAMSDPFRTDALVTGFGTGGGVLGAAIDVIGEGNEKSSSSIITGCDWNSLAKGDLDTIRFLLNSSARACFNPSIKSFFRDFIVRLLRQSLSTSSLMIWSFVSLFKSLGRPDLFEMI